jgi:hypothetical protein
MTPDSNKFHFLTQVTSLLIPQRMNSFNKEKKVYFVKWQYSGLPFFCHLWLSLRLHVTAVAILTNRLIFFSTTFLESFIYCPSNTLVIESETYLARGW